MLGRGREIGKEGRECWAEGEKKGGPSGQMRERFSSFFQNPFLFLNSISFLNSKLFQI